MSGSRPKPVYLLLLVVGLAFMGAGIFARHIVVWAVGAVLFGMALANRGKGLFTGKRDDE